MEHRPHVHHRSPHWHFFGLISSLVVAMMLVGVVGFIFKQNPSKSAFAGNYNAQDVIESVNQERIKKNLPALKTNPKLMEAARNKVDDMIINNYFAHISPVDGKKWSTFIRNSGYDYIEAGENLANGFDNTQDLTTAWMNSPTHRDNILNPDVDETGLAVKSGFLDGYPTIFVAQTFGKRDENTVNSANSAEKSTNTSTPAKNIPSTPTAEQKNNSVNNQKPPQNNQSKIDKSKKITDRLKLPDSVNINFEKMFEL